MRRSRRWRCDERRGGGVNRHHRWFVEEMGRAVGADGLTRIAGRIFAYLLLSERPASLDDIADDLAVSKASVSTEARRLEARGVLLRVRRVNDRRDYYTVAEDFHARRLEHTIERWSRVRDVLQRTREKVPKLSARVRGRLAYMAEVQDFMSQRLEQALVLWAKKRRG